MVQEDGSLAYAFIRQGSEWKQAGKKEALIEQRQLFKLVIFERRAQTFVK